VNNPLNECATGPPLAHTFLLLHPRISVGRVLDGAELVLGTSANARERLAFSGDLNIVQSKGDASVSLLVVGVGVNRHPAIVSAHKIARVYNRLNLRVHYPRHVLGR
jgi:hypothetical protein